jgi:hypothetical protein
LISWTAITNYRLEHCYLLAIGRNWRRIGEEERKNRGMIDSVAGVCYKIFVEFLSSPSLWLITYPRLQ